jgi:uncharacterized radical SAM superfamily Fe-S cluster-containing enzyme
MRRASPLSREQVEAGLDAFVRAEGAPEVVMLSGGEPTIHPSILEFVALAATRGNVGQAHDGAKIH